MILFRNLNTIFGDSPKCPKINTAFDFFVTAEHIVDWTHPKDREKRKELRGLPLLAVTSHIANDAKHFEVTAKHHQSVEDVEKSRYVKAGYVKEDYSDDLLLIHLSPMYQEYLELLA